MNELFLKTEDNIKIAINHYQTGHDTVVIICPGWFMTKDSRAFKTIAGNFARNFDVISMDFRGHGRRGGFYTFTAKECKDLDTVVAYASEKHNKIFIIGFSLGAGLALMYAAGHSELYGVIAVSPHARFYGIENHMWHPNAWIPTLFKKFEPSRWFSIRPASPFLKKTNPIEIVDKINVPVLFIAGAKDKTVYPHHTKELFDKALCDKSFKLYENGIHAEDIFMDEKQDSFNLCDEWIKAQL